MAINNIMEFQKKYLVDIVEKIEEPKWTPNESDINRWILKTMLEKEGRKAFPGQLEGAIAPLFNHLKQNKGALLLAKMGTGKTQMSNDIAYLLFKDQWEKKGANVVFLASGGKHIPKMAREAKEILGDNIDDIYVIKTNPRKRRVKANGFSYKEISPWDVSKIKRVPGKINYFILSKDTGKVSYKLQFFSPEKCPDCGADAGKGQMYCVKCSTKFAQAKKSRGSKADIPTIFKKIQGYKQNKLFDFAIIDEVHEFQSAYSAQFKIYQALIKASAKSLIMTGTLSNGKASSVFYILYPLFAQRFKEYGGFDFDKVGSFVSLFGSLEYTLMKDIGGKSRTSVKELPQISDRIVGFLAPFTVWLSIEDIGKTMPPLKEFFHEVPNKEMENALLNILVAERMHKIDELTQQGYSVNQNSFKIGNEPIYMLNNIFKDYRLTRKVEVERDGVKEKKEVELFIQSRSFAHKDVIQKQISPKEEKFLEIVKAEKAEGRRCLVYGEYINVNSLFERLGEVIDRFAPGITYRVIDASPEKIEEEITSCEEDVVFVSQRKVATGLDLVQYQTVIFYEICEQVRVVEQAKVRPWRPVGQPHEVRVHFIGMGSKQINSITNMAHKMRATAAVDGTPVEEGSLAALFDYDPEITEAIREISSELKEIEAESDSIKKELGWLGKEYEKALNGAKVTSQDAVAFVQEEPNEFIECSNIAQEQEHEEEEKDDYDSYASYVKEIIRVEDGGQLSLGF